MGNIEIAMSRKSVDLKKSTIFIAGVYGTGKSTMCSALSKMLHIPAFSAGDLISSINGEKYGANKTVTDKDGNQALLVERVQQLFKKYERIILAGHFCIFNANAGIEILPESVYHALSISQIILLETNSQTIISNLRRRDGMAYSLKSISKLIEKEREQSERISEQLNCPLSIYQMTFTDQDVQQIALLISQGEKI
ncbi:putative uncharacterized protein [Acidaminococcus sp. CAG:917]|nr:putative uncharacterized protein [Acidaminococcus sp. CAG:917]